MINVTAQELETILAKIESALSMHDDWRDQVQRYLICKTSPREEDIADDAHHLCAFGQWYYGSGNANLRKLPSFQRIEEIHRLMHGRAREVCLLRKKNWPITVKDYDLYASELKRFRTELLGLRQKIYETLHKIDPLTGAYANIHLLPELEKDQALKKTSGLPYSLLLLRFDLLIINQVLGRDKGDELLRSSIAGIRAILDIGDKIYRYAGAEFVICLPGRNADHARELLDQCFDVIGKELINLSGSLLSKMDVYHGIVDLEPDVYVEQLIRHAKRATYTITI